jgi:hypothetical protein
MDVYAKFKFNTRALINFFCAAKLASLLSLKEVNKWPSYIWQDSCKLLVTKYRQKLILQKSLLLVQTRPSMYHYCNSNEARIKKSTQPLVHILHENLKAISFLSSFLNLRGIWFIFVNLESSLIFMFLSWK